MTHFAVPDFTLMFRRVALCCVLAAIMFLATAAAGIAAPPASMIDAEHPVGTAWSEGPRVEAASSDHVVRAAPRYVAAPQADLPFTGIDSASLVWIASLGLAFTAAGATLLVAGRR